MTNKKNQRKNKYDHHTSQPPKVQINEEQLLNECLQMHELLKNRTAKLRKLQTGDFCYILSTKWLRDWKDYVGYQQSTGTETQGKYKDKSYGRRAPGKMNTDIIASSSETRQIYELPKQMADYDYLRKIIAQKKDKDDDYIAVTQDIWFGFLQFYEGEEIRRPVRKLKGSTFYDSQPLRCDTIIVNLQEEQLEERIKKTPKKSYTSVFPSDKMILPTVWGYKQLQAFFKEYCRITYGHDNIRIWKGFGYVATNPIVEAIVESIKQKKYLIKGRLVTLQRYGQADIDQFIKSTHTLIVEIGQALKQDKQDDKIIGYCQECVNKKELTFSCVCCEVVYCSNKCRIDDQSFHYKTCNRAFDSEDDQEYQLKTAKDIPLAGIENLGNTCYMNSTLQAILSLDYFRNFFATNEYLKHLNQKELKENNCKLLRKISKTIKQLNQAEKSYAPWPLKGQIDYNISPFKGYKQHDANDFLINFFTTINDYLSKQGEKPFNKVLEPFVGEFHSKIICPHCNIKSENNEIFTQISLPIKSKAKVQTYSYCVVENVNKIVRGRANLYQSWTQMKISVKVPSQAVVFFTREPEGLVLVDEAEKAPEQTIKGLKGELVYFKNLQVVESQYLFVVRLVTMKVICGSKMKQSIGSPSLISINDITTTLGTLWLKIIRQFFFLDQHIVEEAQKMEDQYFNEITEAIKHDNQSQKMKEEKQDTKAQKDKQPEEQKESQQCRKIVENYSNKLRLFAQRIGIEIYINHYKKERKICAFCNKKCSNCDLPKIFDQSFQDFFANRYQQVRFQVFLRQTPTIDYGQQDLSSLGDPNIQDCLVLFNQPEQLDEENAWYCQNCDNMALALKELQVRMFPPVLVIHLNRFKNLDGKKVKNNDPILYNEVEIFGKNEYRLIAAIIHEGSIDAGHYWSICLRENQYYVFNDSKVSKIQKVYHKNAYILIYCDLRFLGS